jgi:hypothetical protein
MDNMIYYKQVKTVPEEAKKAITGGRLKGMTDINPMWRIKMLTEMFGPVGIGWYYKIVDKRIETIDTQSAAFVDIELFYKHNGEWSMPVQGTGGSSFLTVESSGKAYMSDECFKMALTDAISIACKAIGFGADVYYAKDRTKYDVAEDKPKATPKPTKLNCNELITVGFTKGYKAEAIEKMCIKKFGHGLEFITIEELQAMITGFKGLADKTEEKKEN